MSKPVRNKFRVRIDRVGKERRTVDNVTFASLKEAKRYQDLKLLLSCGRITELKLQQRFDLMVNGQKVGAYVADFVYRRSGQDYSGLIVEDAKGYKTDVYRLKKKLMQAIYGIEIQEV